MEKVRKFGGIWNAERILRNILCYANEKGFTSTEVTSTEVMVLSVF